MSRVVSVGAAKTHLSRLLDEGLLGEEIVIASDGVALVRLVPVATPAPQRTLGHWRGKVVLGPEFDAPLPAEVAEGLGTR